MNQTLELETPADRQAVEMGTRIGRGQAFGMIASRCSAAQAECLRQAKQERLHEKLGLKWDEYCENYAGISRSHARRLILRLEEFGPSYFQLSDIVPISPESYRLIAEAVREDGIEIDGGMVPITRENALRIRALLEARRAEHARESQQKPTAPPSLRRVERRLDACMRNLAAIARSEMDQDTYRELRTLAGRLIHELMAVANHP